MGAATPALNQPKALSSPQRLRPHPLNQPSRPVHLGTDALTKAQKTDLISDHNQLNPAAITRRIIEFQDVLIAWPRTKQTSTCFAQIPSILPDVHKGIRVKKASRPSPDYAGIPA